MIQHRLPLLLTSLLLVSCASPSATSGTLTSTYVEPRLPKERPMLAFLGSSVTYGHATGGYSFVNYIADHYYCDTHKEAVSGTTLAQTSSTDKSYVSRFLSSTINNQEVEHLIIQLSTNDATQGKQYGDVDYTASAEDPDPNDYDPSTTIGAMEYLIAFAKSTWGCRVSFYTNPPYNSQRYQQLVNALYEVQEKWDIGIIDFWNYTDMEPLTKEELSAYMSDDIHPNRTGYNWMGEIMGDYINACYQEDHPGYLLRH